VNPPPKPVIPTGGTALFGTPGVEESLSRFAVAAQAMKTELEPMGK
jgi:hypothetical protein